MKVTSETRYIVTDIVAIPIIHLSKKSDAYKQATKAGCGVVDTDENNELFCDEDSSMTLIDKWGHESGAYPYEKINAKEWPKQSDCKVIIQSDSCGYSYWAEEDDDIQIFVTYDENGFINTYRLGAWYEKPEDKEKVIKFEDLPTQDPYFDKKI
jgi:hypothetical protein